LPVLGPSTARDTVASVANFVGGDAWYNVTVQNDTKYFSEFDYYCIKSNCWS
jgi:phospholipid-binding lipoprotein MlaA